MGSGSLYVTGNNIYFALTAAHLICHYDKKEDEVSHFFTNLRYYRGRHGENQWYDKFKCVKAYPHPKYQGEDSGYDIAIVTLMLINGKIHKNCKSVEVDCFRTRVKDPK